MRLVGESDSEVRSGARGFRGDGKGEDGAAPGFAGSGRADPPLSPAVEQPTGPSWI